MNVRPVHLCVFAACTGSGTRKNSGDGGECMCINYSAVMNIWVRVPTADFRVLWLLLCVYHLSPVPLRPDTDHTCAVPSAQAQRWAFAVKVHAYFVMSFSRCGTGLCPCTGSFHTEEVSVLVFGSHKAWDYPMVWGICVTNDKEDMRSFF